MRYEVEIGNACELARVAGWESLLAEFLAAARGEAFEWRDWNCALFAAAWVEACTGADLAAEFRPFCEGPLSAMRLVRDRGGLARIVSGLGLERVPARMARRGDVGLLRWRNAAGKRREALGVVEGARVAFASRDGLEFRPLLDLAKAWRVG